MVPNFRVSNILKALVGIAVAVTFNVDAISLSHTWEVQLPNRAPSVYQGGFELAAFRGSQAFLV